MAFYIAFIKFAQHFTTNAEKYGTHTLDKHHQFFGGRHSWPIELMLL